MLSLHSQEMDNLVADIIEWLLWELENGVELMHPARLNDRHNTLELLSRDEEFIELYRFPRNKIIEIVDLAREENSRVLNKPI